MIKTTISTKPKITIMKTKMKIFTLVSLFCAVLLTGCKKEDADVNASALSGTWSISEVYLNGEWNEITKLVDSKIMTPASFTFDASLTYSFTGHFGDQTGSYEVAGNTVTAYVPKLDKDGNVVYIKDKIQYEEYIKFKVISLTDSDFECNMTTKTGYYHIKCKK